MEEGKIKEVILDVAKRYGIEIDRIILFGSRARGDFKKDSDWDILIVTKEKIEERLRYNFISKLIKKIVWEFDISTDIIVVSKEYYEKYKDVCGDICGIATLEGMVL